MNEHHHEKEQHKNQSVQPPQDIHSVAQSHMEVPPIQKNEEQEQFKEQSPEEIAEVAINTIVCYFCKDLILSTVETVCGHAFCEHCLTEYLLVCKECPICGLPIREKKGAANKSLDLIIEQFCQFMGQTEFQGFKERKQKQRLMKEEKKEEQKKFRLENGRAGSLVDIRDEQYIWRKGRIVRTFNRVNSDQSRIKFLIVQYLDTEKKEEVLLHSARLARPGQYTDRKDLPKYQKHSHEDAEKVLSPKSEPMGEDGEDIPEINQKIQEDGGEQ